jgi:hypothetical protein
MGEPESAGPTVVLPERLDRRLRFGPFPSARDGLKFVLYAAVGALVALFASPYVWLPIVGVGFAVSVYRPDGEGLDGRLVAFVRWQGRRRWEAPMRPGPVGPAIRRGLARPPTGGTLAVVRTGGVPLAYLPPTELERRFAQFRDLLRELDGSFAWVVGVEPMRPSAVAPAARCGGRADGAARAGYAELVEVLCRRRSLRRVDFVLTDPRPEAAGIAETERKVRRVTEGLAALGLRPRRLKGRALHDAVRGVDASAGREAA